MNRSTRRLFLKQTMATLFTTGVMAKDCEDTAFNGYGPFYPREPIPETADLTRAHVDATYAKGTHVYMFGQVIDDQCMEVSGAKIEIWQCDSNGHYKHPNSQGQDQLDPGFRYFGSATTDEKGRYLFKTVMPSSYSLGRLVRAPHIHFNIVSDQHHRLTSEMQFGGLEEDQIRERDTVFLGIEAGKREALIVPKDAPAKHADWPFPFEDGAICCRFYPVLRRK